MKRIYKKPLMEEVVLRTDFQLLAGSTNAQGGVTVDPWDTDSDDQSNP